MPSGMTLAVLTGALFAGVFALLYAVDDTRAGVAALFAVPIAAAALGFGRRGGIAGAVLAALLTLTWLVTSNAHLGALGWLSRLIPFFVIGLAIGVYEDLTRRNERRRLDERYAAELHDQVVQSLVIAHYALQGDEADPQARRAVEDALEGAKQIISSRMGAIEPGDLRLEGAPPGATPQRERPSP